MTTKMELKDYGRNAVAGVLYRIHSNMRVIAGYKALYQDYMKGSGRHRFEWDMTLHGPMIDLGISF